MVIEQSNFKRKEKELLDQKIFAIEEKNKDIVDQIEELQEKIKRLKKEKRFINFSRKIKKLEIKITTLKEEIDENEKNTLPLKDLKLNVLWEIIKLQRNVYIDEIKFYQGRFQTLDVIVNNSGSQITMHPSAPVAGNPFEEDDSETEIFDDGSSSLEIKVKELDQKIEAIEKTNKEILDQIEDLECEIEDFRQQKKEKNWQLTFFNVITIGFFKYFRNKNFNKNIKKIKIKTRDLTKELAKNEKIKQLFNDSKLNLFEDISDLQVQVFNRTKMQKDQEISEKLNIILENQQPEQFDDSNPFATKKQSMSRYSSQDSAFSSETELARINETGSDVSLVNGEENSIIIHL